MVRGTGAPAMKKSLLVAALLAIAAVGWILSGQIGRVGGEGKPATAALDGRESGQRPLVRVRVANLTAEAHERSVVVSGRTEASREVNVRAETYGRIVEVLIKKGDVVERGQVLGRIAVDDRRAKLSEAEALHKQREIEFSAASQLRAKGFRSETSLAAAAARLKAANAAVEQIRIDISRTTVRAPFAGVIAENWAELGAYVKVGDVAGTIVDLDPINIVGYATEREVGLLQTGSSGRARLIDGSEVVGIIVFVAPVAEETTRTFRFELEVANPDLHIRAGLTAEIAVPVAQELSHLVSPAVLTLADDGTVGVKVVDAADVVRFLPVRIIGDSPSGVWVGGLPSVVRLITVGQEFVVPGQRVEAVEAAAPTGHAGGA